MIRRRPSRFMPQFEPHPENKWATWLVLLIFAAIVLYFLWQLPWSLVLLPIIYVLSRRTLKKQQAHLNALRQARSQASICTFARHFECREMDTWVIRAVYEQLQNYMFEAHEQVNFPILPTDDVFKDLFVDDEDFELDIVKEIAQRTGRSLENVAQNPFCEQAHIVENLVYFFNAQPIVADGKSVMLSKHNSPQAQWHKQE